MTNKNNKIPEIFEGVFAEEGEPISQHYDYESLLPSGYELMLPGTYIKDYFSSRELNNYETGSNIFINADTGAGKTTFALKEVKESALIKNTGILYLVPRTRIKESISKALRKAKISEDLIKVQTYQKIVHDKLKSNMEISERYGFIVCDEYHFFTNDSSFNYDTQLAFELIMRANATRIFISATPDNLYDKVRDNSLYNNNRCDRFIFKRSLESIYQLYPHHEEKARTNQLLDIIESGKKAMVFIDDKKKLFKLYEQFKDISTFVVSKNSNNPEYFQYVNNDEVNELLTTGKIPKQILFTTSVMIEGIDIIDEDLDTIFIETTSINKAVQAIGRDRLLKAKIVVRSVTTRKAIYLKKQAEKKLMLAYRINNNSLDYDESKHIFKDSSREFLEFDNNTGKIRIKSLAIIRLKAEIMSYDSIIENGIHRSILMSLGGKGTIYEPIENSFKGHEILEFCYNNLNKKFFSDEQKTITDIIGKARKYSNENSTSLSSAQRGIDRYTMGVYYLESEKEKSRRSKYRDQWYWIIKTKDSNINLTKKLDEEAYKNQEKKALDQLSKTKRFDELNETKELLDSLVGKNIVKTKYNDLVMAINNGIRKDSKEFKTTVKKCQEKLDEMFKDVYEIEVFRKSVNGKRNTYWKLNKLR